ncbi:ABC transporter substrate-binding protein [Pseudokineococcus marinus]|uniref:ABC transporter substrate-binding protein n=1 Tax=Pseudokineococcus marinus TaxID=351215 RepID=UPI002ADD8957|nr:ABC transporter substrate-binding protein [Pseudokineococcus marinus]
MQQTDDTAEVLLVGASARSGRHARAARRAAGASAALAAALVLSSCYAVQDTIATVDRTDAVGEPLGDTPVREGGDLVMGLSAEPDALDPTTSSSLYTRYVMASICEKLYDLDADGELVPQLATDLPTVSEDGLQVDIPVREDVVFGDGTPFDAEAVATTLQRHLDLPSSSRASEMGPITDIAALDATTVRLTYETPFAPITAALADRAGMIMSPTALEELGEDFGSSPTCVGPFRFVERVPQTEIVVERDPGYYAADEVHLDTITYRIMTDASIRAANLRSGDVQVADTISTQDADAMSRESGLTLLQSSSLGYQAVTFNVGNVDGTGQPPGEVDTPEAQDARVRQAFSLAVDREALVATVFNGWFDAACSPISPDSPFSTPASEACPEHDPEAALALLREAGVEPPLQIDMQISNTPDSLRLGQALQASVQAGGFDVRISPVEYSTLLDVQSRGDFRMLQLGWSGRVDPAANTQNFLSTGAGNNYSGYSDEEMDALLAEASQGTDQAARAEVYGEVVTKVQEDDPVVYLYRQRNLTAHTDEVAGVQTFADGVVRLSRAAFVGDDDGADDDTAADTAGEG